MTARGVRVGTAAPTGIGEVLFSSRSYREYRAMFALTDAELAGRLLDCPGGAADFTATATAIGADVYACDPAYVARPAELDARSLADLHRARCYVEAHPEEYTWSFFADLDTYGTERAASRAAFVAHYAHHRERYLAAQLPDLPFVDGAFDLVLCSHLLFSWADRLDLDFHEAAITEMTRVGAAARIFPTFAMGADPVLDLDPLLCRLRRQGIAAKFCPVDYLFQRGQPLMLEVARRS
jgi:SAM-dependent methyltransferase